MKCPVDQTPLTIADRQGIEIDFCPTCRGVWLDRGELDKLIERSTGFNDAPRQEYREERRPEHHQERRPGHHDHDDDEYRQDHGHGKHHKKESFLGDIFDF